MLREGPPRGLRSPPESPQHVAQPERKSEQGALGTARSLAYTVPSCPKPGPKDSSPEPHGHSFLDLKHFTSGVSGFLADEFAIGFFLRLLQEQLDELSSHGPLSSQSCWKARVARAAETDCRVSLQFSSKVPSRRPSGGTRW